jgi:hypothetical protein
VVSAVTIGRTTSSVENVLGLLVLRYQGDETGSTASLKTDGSRSTTAQSAIDECNYQQAQRLMTTLSKISREMLADTYSLPLSWWRDVESH